MFSKFNNVREKNMQQHARESLRNSILSNTKKLLADVQQELQAECKDLDALEAYKKTASFEAQFERLKDTFHESHGYKSVMWCVLFDLGRIFRRVMGYRYSAEDQQYDYIAIDRVLMNGQSDKAILEHQAAIETQGLLNKAGAGIRKIQQQHMRKINRARSYLPTSKLVGCLAGMFIGWCLWFAVSESLLMSLLMLSGYCGAAFLLRFSYIEVKRVLISSQKIDDKDAHHDHARAISTLSYWSYLILEYLGDNFALGLLGFIGALATLAIIPNLSIAVAVMFVIALILDDDYSASDFASLVNSIYSSTAYYIIAVTEAVLSLELFYSWSTEFSWASIKNKISQCKVDWWRFARGFGYTTAEYLVAYGPMLMTHPWTVIASQWFVLALMNAVVLAMQTLAEEIKFRGPLIDNQQTANEVILNVLVSATIFGCAHINNPEFDVIGESPIAQIALLFEYVLSGLSWGISAYLSGGLELSWGMHYANNLLLTTLVGYTPCPTAAMPLITIDISKDAHQPSAASIFSPNTLTSYVGIKLLIELASWAPIYLCETFFRPKYYVEPLGNFEAASMLAPSKEHPEVLSERPQADDQESQKPSEKMWSLFDIPHHVRCVTNRWFRQLSPAMNTT